MPTVKFDSSKDLDPETYMKLICYIVNRDFKKYCNCDADIQELISVGYTELLIEIRKINQGKVRQNNRRYIVKCVRYAIKGYIAQWTEYRTKVKLDESIHIRYDKPKYEHGSKTVHLLDELEARIKNPRIKRAFQLYRQGYSYEDINKEIGYATVNLLQETLNNHLRMYAIQIMKQRSNGAINSLNMFD